MAWTDQETQRLVQLHQEGYSFSQIAREIGKDKKTCQKKMKRLRDPKENPQKLKEDALEQALRLYNENPNITACAEKLGINRATFRHRYHKALEHFKEGPRVGPEPVPDGQNEKERSTLYDGEQNLRLEWIKTEPDRERQRQIMEEAAHELSKKLPRLKPVSPPKQTDSQLLNLYCLTDIHLGMLAWHEETRDRDWDTEEAEQMLVGWVQAAIEQSPGAEVGLLGQLGDLLHWDGLLPITPINGNVLDADTRFAKLVRVAIRAVRRVISMLLKKHNHVHVVMATGNHDQSSSVWMREFFTTLYEDEPRITIDRSPDVYYAYEWGDTSLFFHHGHKRKPEDVSRVFGGLFREIYGRTKHAYGHLGDKHSDKTIENELMVIEQHRTLAARDAHASSSGYVAGSDAKVITYHKQFGEVARKTINPDMVRHLIDI